MKTAIYFLCFLFSTVASAQTASLVGDFTHDYTKPKNKSVWTVQDIRGAWTVYSHGEKVTFKAKILNEEERIRFWGKMWWPTTTAAHADCLAYEDSLICHIPEKEKLKIDDIKNKKSEYFHYDAIGGLMEISLKKQLSK